MQITVDTADLAVGQHEATVVISTTDPGARRFEVPLTLTVASDACPAGFSAERTIAFGDADSGVPNDHRGDGCTFLDLVWDQAPFDDHGHFVRAVRDLTVEWRDDGLLTRREAQAILVAAAHSDVARGGAAAR